jgi:SpoVK/Ycf46/Vps4 family AAA+-type ATPase
MRPGRFDRKIRMPKPDTEGRYEILKLHLKSKEVGVKSTFCKVLLFILPSHTLSRLALMWTSCSLQGTFPDLSEQTLPTLSMKPS